jgi:hypothetical protein
VSEVRVRVSEVRARARDRDRVRRVVDGLGLDPNP